MHYENKSPLATLSSMMITPAMQVAISRKAFNTMYACRERAYHQTGSPCVIAITEEEDP